MRRLTVIAALLVLVMMMPLARACAVVLHGAKAQQDCCKHNDPADAGCAMPSNLCCAAQAPIDTTPYPVQSVLRLVLPSAIVAVVYNDRTDGLKARCLALYSPAQHSPPGLVIAATIVLRI